MLVKLQNTLTGKFFNFGRWESSMNEAEWIETKSPEFIIIKHTWEMTHVRQWSETNVKGFELIQKAKLMREKASLNRGAYRNRIKVERMLKGRAESMHTKGIMLLNS